MKPLKIVLSAALLLAALIGFGWFFVSQLGSAERSSEPAGVLLSAPPNYEVIERGELSFKDAAAELEAQVLRSGSGEVALHFKRQGAEVYWLADPGADVLEERSAGASGTRLQTIWRGGLRERLIWAQEHGNFDAPGLPAGESKNLYH
ncbi:MAG TPA: hypothetical protein VH394_20270 [Thermoanaerobaculia bacterium]|jgi:hypothetical protein|nr:hypothetical protein [Thermoanaerobaculia bacterium]